MLTCTKNSIARFLFFVWGSTRLHESPLYVINEWRDEKEFSKEPSNGGGLCSFLYIFSLSSSWISLVSWGTEISPNTTNFVECPSSMELPSSRSVFSRYFYTNNLIICCNTNINIHTYTYMHPHICMHDVTHSHINMHTYIHTYMWWLDLNFCNSNAKGMFSFLPANDSWLHRLSTHLHPLVVELVLE